jgi:7-cyano-7-deazaguanine reductase
MCFDAPRGGRNLLGAARRRFMTPEQSQLGKASAYIDQYDASLLFPIPRAGKRAEIGIDGPLPFLGADMWTAFELSWLNLRGKPQLALAHFTVPCETANIIESKSFKLYLNSFNNTPFASADEVKARLRADLSEAVWREATPQGERLVPASIGVSLLGPDMFDREPVHELDGLSLDRLDIDCTRYTPAPELLTATPHEAPVSEVFTSNLLKSNCLVTGQPDWGSVQISYTGDQIEQGGLLQYLVSFRNHNEFHEQCVERIFMDIWTRCKPMKLAVYARYTRRGGLDINPFRTSYPAPLPRNIRHARQ